MATTVSVPTKKSEEPKKEGTVRQPEQSQGKKLHIPGVKENPYIYVVIGTCVLVTSSFLVEYFGAILGVPSWIRLVIILGVSVLFGLAIFWDEIFWDEITTEQGEII